MEKEKSFEQVLTELVEKDLINEPEHYKGKKRNGSDRRDQKFCTLSGIC